MDVSWEEIASLPEFLLGNLRDSGFPEPFPVQVSVIGQYFQTDHDLSIGFPTGSGKTLAYLVPMIAQLHARIVPRTRGLVIVPSRRLAEQVVDVANLLVKGSNLTVSILKQPMESKPDILVASVTSLATYVSEVDEALLAHVEVIVVDENDAIMELPLENWLDPIEHSLTYCPSCQITFPLQNFSDPERRIRRILCSATLSRSSKHKEVFKMDDAIQIVSTDRSRYSVPMGIVEEFVVVEHSQKIAAVVDLCHRFQFVLCFVGSNKRARFISKVVPSIDPMIDVLNFEDIKVKPSHRALVVSTDALARGVDIPLVECVINFDIPGSSRTYVHRMGRTARGGAQGVCISLLHSNELMAFRDILQKIEGSTPKEIRLDLRRFNNDRFRDIVRPLDRMKTWKPPTKTKGGVESSESESEGTE